MGAGAGGAALRQPPGEQPEHRHHRQALVPEGDHHRGAGGMWHDMLHPLQPPARGAQREGEVEAEQVGEQFLDGGVPQQSFHCGGR